MTILIVIALCGTAVLFFALALARSQEETPLEEQARCLREQEKAKAEKKRRREERRRRKKE